MQTTEQACPRILTYRPPRIALSLLIAAALTQLALPADWGQLRSFTAAGAVVGVIGFALMIRAWWLFRVQDTAICPTAETTTLITRDVYRLTRNPMYLGMVMMLLGVGLFAGGILYYVVAASFFAIIDHSFCPYEEHKLQAVFGDQFTLYTKKVHRWI